MSDALEALRLELGELRERRERQEQERRELREDTRLIVSRCVTEGMSGTEIAVALGVSHQRVYAILGVAPEEVMKP